MNKKILPLALVLAFVSLTGCKKDDEIGSVLKELARTLYRTKASGEHHGLKRFAIF